MGNHRARMGNYEKARFASESIKSYSSNSKVRLGLAEIHEERIEFDKARECFREGEAYAACKGDAGFSSLGFI